MNYAVLIILLIIALIAFVLWFEIVMFVDVIKHPKLSDNEKLLWVLGMLLLHPFVAIYYCFTTRSRLG